ncbi:MAG: phosphate ABC transporter permease PstA [Pseudonocardiaceae bacterium]
MTTVTEISAAPPPHSEGATAPQEIRRAVGARRRSDVVAAVGAGAASLSLTALLFTQIAPLSGVAVFVIVAYGLFLGFYAVLVGLADNALAVRDRVASAIMHGLGFLALLALVFVVGFTFWRAREALPHLNFYTQDMSNAGSLDPLTLGGVTHAVVGTLVQITIALLITIPLGLACAVFLAETSGGFTRFVRTIVEAMTALPSIVAGLFIFAALILVLGMPKSGFAAGCAISVMMLPIIIRSADVVIRLVPGSLKEASFALGAPQWRTAWCVVLPTARPALTTAVLLGAARGLGETSPVLLTAGFSSSLNFNPFSDPQVSLPLNTFILVNSPQPAMIARGFGSAAVLMVVVLVLFGFARVFGGREVGDLSARQQRRRALASAEDLERFGSPRAADKFSGMTPAAAEGGE